MLLQSPTARAASERYLAPALPEKKTSFSIRTSTLAGKTRASLKILTVLPWNIDKKN